MLGDLSFDNLRMLHAAPGGVKVGVSQSVTNTSVSNDKQSQDDDQGLTAVWRAIKDRRMLTCNLEQQLIEVAGQLRELLREGVQGNKNNLLNQAEGGNLSRPIVNQISQIRRRPIVDDELNFGADPINPGIGRFERN